MNFLVDRNRIFALNRHPLYESGKIIYWMSREHRIDNNWALLHAVELADEKRDLEVVFVLSRIFTGFTARGFDFCVSGLKETENRARELGIKFTLLTGGRPSDILKNHAEENQAAAVVCDFNPLRESIREHKNLAENLSIPLIEVDSHNIVPARFISAKQEYGAFTLRKKIEKVLPEFLVPFPRIEKKTEDVNSNRTGLSKTSEKIDWTRIKKDFKPEDGTEPANEIVPGYTRGNELLEEFIDEKLFKYSEERNDPNKGAQSGLSPYFHFGQISAQAAALAAAEVFQDAPLKGGFLDELIVRRELSENFCLYNNYYDSSDCFPDWAKQSLGVHTADRREYLYSLDELEKAETHERLWNAAQKQLLIQGKIHGYMRMYWAKKILEWSPDASEAMRRAVFLNDRYSLDGHDPNGYAGCAWAIGGLHDRAWANRKVFGKVRYMNEKGCRRKFDVERYIQNLLQE